MAFADEANSRTGEALETIVRIRADTDGGTNQLVVLSDLEPVVRVSNLRRKREREYGIIEGLEWSVTFSNAKGTFNPASSEWPILDPSIIFKWADLQIGFPVANQWKIVANGRIERIEVDTNGLFRMHVRDPVMDLVQSEIRRDWKWTDTGWVSPMRDGVLAAGSDSFDNSGNPLTIEPGNETFLGNLTYKIVFTTATLFDIIHVNEPGLGYDQTGLSKSSDQKIKRFTAVDIVDIPTAGWGTTVAGDTFFIYTSKKYTSAQMNPIDVLAEVIDELGQFYRRVSNGALSVARASGPISTWAGVSARHTAVSLADSEFEAATSGAVLIEGILIGVACSLFPNIDGTIGIYHFHPDDAGSGGPTVSGDPESGDTTVISAVRRESVKWRATSIVFDYLNTDGVQAQFIATDADPPVGVDIVHPLSSPWRWTSGQIEATTNQAMLRRSAYSPQFDIKGTLLELLELDLSEPMNFTDPELGETVVKLQVSELDVDIMNNTVRAIAWNDPIVDGTFARVNVTDVDDPEVIY